MSGTADTHGLVGRDGEADSDRLRFRTTAPHPSPATRDWPSAALLDFGVEQRSLDVARRK